MLLARHNQLSPVAVPQLPAEPLSFARVQGRFLKVLEGWQAQGDAAPLRTVQPPLVQEGPHFRVAGQPASQTLFERGDNGALQTYRKDPTTALRMIEVAKQQNWPQVVAQGSQAFRRQAWLYGAVHGLEVQGYQPTKGDLRRLESLKNLQNTLKPGKEPIQEAEKDAQKASQGTEKPGQEPLQGAKKEPNKEPKAHIRPNSEPDSGKNPRAAGLKPAPGPKYASRPRTAVRQASRPTPPKSNFLVTREIYKSLDRHLRNKDPAALLGYWLHTPYLGVGQEPPERVITNAIKDLLPARFHDRIPKRPDFDAIRDLFRRANRPLSSFEKALFQAGRSARQSLTLNMIEARRHQPGPQRKAHFFKTVEAPPYLQGRVYDTFEALEDFAKARLSPQSSQAGDMKKRLGTHLNGLPAAQEGEFFRSIQKDFPHLQPAYLQVREQQAKRLVTSFPDLAKFLEEREPAFYANTYMAAKSAGPKHLRDDPRMQDNVPAYFKREGAAFLNYLTGPQGEKHFQDLVQKEGLAPPTRPIKVPRADLGGQLGRQAYQASVKPMPAGPERGMG